MPVFKKEKIAFIHIPKTGGTSIVTAFLEMGYKREPISTTNHSPQHSTLNELYELGFVDDSYKIITSIRHPYARFTSEYNYRREHGYADSIEQFALDFFSGGDWDNHNLSMSQFLNVDKVIAPKITYILYDTIGLDFKKITGKELTAHLMKSEKPHEILSPNLKQIIAKYWKDDFINFPIFKI